MNFWTIVLASIIGYFSVLGLALIVFYALNANFRRITKRPQATRRIKPFYTDPETLKDIERLRKGKTDA